MKNVVEQLLKIPNIVNHNVSIKFKWTSQSPLYLISIKSSMDKYAKQLSTIKLKTLIDEDTSTSIILQRSKSNKYILNPSTWTTINVSVRTKLIVCAFIHQFEQQHHMLFAI
eukprot:381242_1